jgi:hypothetical protein
VWVDIVCFAVQLPFAWARPRKVRGVTLGSALKVPVRNLSLKWLRLSEFMVDACHWYLGVTRLSVCRASAIWCYLAQCTAVGSHENSFDLAGGITDWHQLKMYLAEVQFCLVRASLIFVSLSRRSRLVFPRCSKNDRTEYAVIQQAYVLCFGSDQK